MAQVLHLMNAPNLHRKVTSDSIRRDETDASLDRDMPASVPGPPSVSRVIAVPPLARYLDSQWLAGLLRSQLPES